MDVRKTDMPELSLLAKSDCERRAGAATLVTMALTGALIASAAAQDSEPGFKDTFALAAKAPKHSCQIIIQQNGKLVQNVGATKLSSQTNAGTPGLAEVTTTNGSYYLSVDRPNGFSAMPNGGNADVWFNASLSGRGKTNFSDTPGENRVKLKNGVTNVEVNLEASKLTGAFPAGHYRAELILRCE
jgi:hypothetical protein